MKPNKQMDQFVIYDDSFVIMMPSTYLWPNLRLYKYN
jgi:hypothetical protein